MDTIGTTVDEAGIAALVDRFYDRVRADERLGPLFAASVGDWDDHLRIMRDFWSGALLRTTRYGGCVMSPHFRMPIAGEDFDRWLTLFRPSAVETLPPAQAAQAIAVAEAVTDVLRRATARPPAGD